MKKTVGILNLGISNTESIKSAVKFLGFDSKLINIEEDFAKFSKIIIPGNGSFPSIAKNFLNNKYKKKLIQYIEKNNYVLGICLGMQIFMKESSEFKITKGIGLFNYKVDKLEFLKKLPNIGYKKIFIRKKKPNKLFENIKNNSEFYFMHSYGVSIFDSDNVDSYLKVSKKKVLGSLSYKNFSGVQFHPEKSKDNGLKLLFNFLRQI